MLRKAILNSAWRNYLRQIPSGCVAYYPGIDGGGALLVDYSPSKLNGTITGATWNKALKGPWGLYFLTDDDVNLSNSATLKPAIITYELWANVPDVNSKAIMGDDNGGAAGSRQGASITIQNDKIYFNRADATQTTVNINKAPPGWNTPIHIVATHDGTNLGLSINAVAAIAVACSGSSVGTGVLSLGKVPFGWNLTGYEYIVRIYNRVITSAEIAGHYGIERRFFGV